MPTAKPLAPCPCCGGRCHEVSLRRDALNVQHAYGCLMGSGYRRASAEKWGEFAVIVAAGLRALDNPVAEQYIEWESREAGGTRQGTQCKMTLRTSLPS